MTTDREYLIEEGIDEYFRLDGTDEEMGVFETVDGSRTEPLPPQIDDLARIHRLIRERKIATVLEFGIGYSTITMCDALMKNKREWEALDDKPDVRNNHMFEIHSVDASEKWLTHWTEQVPPEFEGLIHTYFSPVSIETFQGRLCHLYESIPDVVPDFIYLDGPHPSQVEGQHRGMSFECLERTVMSADILELESTLLPGTCILVDGRTNNARFIEQNLQRDFKCDERPNEDVTFFELDEEPLGKYNQNWPFVNSSTNF